MDVSPSSMEGRRSEPAGTLLQQDPQRLPARASPMAALPQGRCATKCSQVSCANALTGVSLSSSLLFTHSPQPISATKAKIKGKLTMQHVPNASGSYEESCSTKRNLANPFSSPAIIMHPPASIY